MSTRWVAYEVYLCLAAPRTDEERARDGGRSDFSSRRELYSSYSSWNILTFCDPADRAPLAPREEVPLPTAPPYTAFVGNLAFDMTETELEDFFAPHKVRVLCAWIMKKKFDNFYLFICRRFRWRSYLIEKENPRDSVMLSLLNLKGLNMLLKSRAGYVALSFSQSPIHVQLLLSDTFTPHYSCKCGWTA